jgi:hypothetical protein
MVIFGMVFDFRFGSRVCHRSGRPKSRETERVTCEIFAA